MATKKSWRSTKTNTKSTKKSEKTVENVVENVTNTGSTVIENEISDVVDAVLNNVPVEEENVSENSDAEKVGFTRRELKKEKIIWTVGSSIVTKPKWRIVFEAQTAPFPMFKLPADIRDYLQSKWLTTEVYKKSKEWLEKHNVDLKMVEKLKDFLTERL